MKNIVVLISGSGTNLQALIDADLQGNLCAVISNRPNVAGLARAEKAGIPAYVLDHTEYPSREAFDDALLTFIDSFSPDLVVLAGFMRILTADFTNHYAGRMLNIHPSLLPKYQGLHTHQRALDAGDSVHGVTVHFVTAELDDGPNVIQAIVPIQPKDTAETLQHRVQQQEHIIYPMAVRWFAESRILMRDNTCWMDGTPLPASGYIIDSRQD